MPISNRGRGLVHDRAADIIKRWRFRLGLTLDVPLGTESGGTAGFTANYVPKGGGAGNPFVTSNIYDDGTSVGINTITPHVNTKLDINGKVRAATGILFGTDTAADNTLDDYEEGTWTVVFTPSISGTITLDPSYNTGKYTKIGNLVTITGDIRVQSVSLPSGSININVPFQSSDNTNMGSQFSGLVAANIADMVAIIGTGVTSMQVFLGDSTARQTDAAEEVQASTICSLGGTYRA